MLVSPTGAYSGYGFAIPTSIMTKVVTDLKQYGTVQRALLGIAGRNMGDETYPDEIRKEQKELGINDGVQVVEVTEGGSVDGRFGKERRYNGIERKESEDHGRITRITG